MDTVHLLTVLQNPVSTDTEAEQSAMDGAELATNRKISQISQMILSHPVPSRE